jgi:hypothetical protein
MKINDLEVRTGNVVLVWDGMRKPNTRNSGSIDYNVGFLMAPTDPSYGEIGEIINQKVRFGTCKGVNPVGDNWPLDRQAEHKYGEQYATWYRLKAGGGAIPPILDQNYNAISPAQYDTVLYAGCIIQLIVSAWDYTKPQAGVALNVHAIMVVDNTAPEMQGLGGGLTNGEAAERFRQGQGQTQNSAPAPGGAPTAPGGAPAAPGAPTAPPAKVMLPGANGVTYEAYVAAGWSDEQMIAGGVLQA